MGWFLNTIKGLVDPRAAGEGIIQSMERVFRAEQKMYPDLDPHWHLTLTWQSRMTTHGIKSDEESQMRAMGKTFRFAHLPFPKNIRALGIATIIFERPDIMSQCPEFDGEFDALLAPLGEADQNGTLLALYAKYNPRLAAEAQKK
jgi:hypothetical protein